MISNNLFFALISFWIFLILLLRLVNNKKFFEKEYNIYTTKTLRHIDNYYIDNKLFTALMLLLYIFFSCLPLLYLRTLYLGEHIYIYKQVTLSNSIFDIFFLIIMFSITWFLYKKLINKIFMKEINKIYLYICSHQRPSDSWISYINDLYINCQTEKFFGFFRVLFYRIAELNYTEELHFHHMINPEVLQKQFDSYYVYFENERIRMFLTQFAEFLMLKVQIHPFLKKTLFKLSNFFNFFQKRSEGFLKKGFYFILIITFLFELYNKDFYYIYFLMLLWYFINLNKQYINFIKKRNYDYDVTIGLFFYCDRESYEEKRKMFNVEGTFIKSEQFSGYNDRDFMESLDKIITYINNDFINNEKNINENISTLDKSLSAMYNRFFFIISYILVLIFSLDKIIYSNLAFLILFVFFLTLMGLHIKGCSGVEFDAWFFHELEEAKRLNARKYNYIFWFLSVILIIFFWIILIRPQLLLLNSELLINIPYFTITKIYTADEKMIYLFQIFESFLDARITDDILNEKEYLRYLLRITMQNYILEETLTLKDLKVFAQLFIDNYELNKIYNEKIFLFITNQIFPFSYSYFNYLLAIFFLGGVAYNYYPLIKLFYMYQTYQGKYAIMASMIKIYNFYKNYTYQEYTQQSYIQILGDFSEMIKKVFQYIFT